MVTVRGGIAVAELAGCHVAGGHSIDGPEPKYGMAVTGTGGPDRRSVAHRRHGEG